MTPAYDGLPLASYRWALPSGLERGRGVYLVHGLSEYAGRYEHVAAWLNARGWDVAAHDHRGHGRSKGRRAALRRSDDLIVDAEQQIAAYAQTLGAPPVVLGHSMGGIVAAHVALRGRIDLAGLVLCSPAMRLKINALEQVLLKTLRVIAPSLPVPNRNARAQRSHDQAVTDAYAADPLVNRVITARLAAFIADYGPLAVAGAHELVPRTLMIVAGADSMVDTAGSRAFADAAPPGRLAMRWHEQAWHEILNETPAIAAPAYADLDAWLTEI